MIKKDRLLAGLKELLYVEEEVVTIYANFNKALANQMEDMSEEKKKEMNALLSALYRDSSRHRETIDKMIKQVKEGTIDEY